MQINAKNIICLDINWIYLNSLFDNSSYSFRVSQCFGGVSPAVDSSVAQSCWLDSRILARLFYSLDSPTLNTGRLSPLWRKMLKIISLLMLVCTTLYFLKNFGGPCSVSGVVSVTCENVNIKILKDSRLAVTTKFNLKTADVLHNIFTIVFIGKRF